MENRIKILITHVDLRFGGVETQLLNLINNLNRNKFEIHLVLSNVKGERLRDVNSDIKVYDLNLKKIQKFNPQIILRISRLVKQIRPDICISFHPFFGIETFLGVRLFSLELPIIECFPGAIQKGRLNFIRKAIYKKNTKNLCVSNGVTTGFKKVYGDYGNIVVINNAVDFQKIVNLSTEKVTLKVQKDKPVLITIGRLIESKGIDFLIRSVSIVNESISCDFWIIGDGPDYIKLKKLAEENHVHATFFGYQENPYKYLHESDLFIFGSYSEGLPTVLLEAMVCKTPIISTNYLGDVKNVIQDGLTGYIVNEHCETIFASRIISVLSDQISSNVITNHAFEFVSTNYSLHKYVNAFDKLFCELLKMPND